MDPQALDLGTVYFFQTHRLPWLTSLMVSLTHRGDQLTLWTDVLLLAAAFLVWRRPRAALLLVVVALASWWTNEAVKAIVKRPRPAEAVRPPVPVPPSYSFPSGHAQNTMTIYFAAALLAVRGLDRRRRLGLLALALLMALAVGTSRLYLGVHYLTDVVGGWLAGLGFALLARWADDLWARDAKVTPAETQTPSEPSPPLPATGAFHVPGSS